MLQIVFCLLWDCSKINNNSDWNFQTSNSVVLGIRDRIGEIRVENGGKPRILPTPREDGVLRRVGSGIFRSIETSFFFRDFYIGTTILRFNKGKEYFIFLTWDTSEISTDSWLVNPTEFKFSETSFFLFYPSTGSCLYFMYVLGRTSLRLSNSESLLSLKTFLWFLLFSENFNRRHESRTPSCSSYLLLFFSVIKLRRKRRQRIQSVLRKFSPSY